MSPKIGQKLTDKPKDVTVRARMDKETLEKLDYLVKKQGLDRSKVILTALSEIIGSTIIRYNNHLTL